MSTTVPYVCWRDPSHAAITTTMFGWPQCGICRSAPPFHDRPKYLPENFALAIYVPVDNRASAIIAPRSAVVGLPNGGEGEDDWTQIYYEGWLNGPMQYGDRDARGLWEAGVEHAAGRMVCAYPTIARADLPSHMLRYIGLYWPATKRLLIDQEDVLEKWLGIDEPCCDPEAVRDYSGNGHDADCDSYDGAPCCQDPGCGGNPCTFPGYSDNH